MLLSFALLLLVGVIFTDGRVYNQTLQASDGNHGHEKIGNGIATRPSPYPFLARLLITTKNGFTINCGGALINRKYVLTHAKCFEDYAYEHLVMVLLGAHDISQFVPYQAVSVLSDITPNGDLCLVRLRENVALSPFIKPICLPSEGSIAMQQKGIASVWQATLHGLNSGVLTQTLGSIVSDEVCDEKYEWKYRTEDMLCVEFDSGSEDRCMFADLGGPLFFNNSRGFTLAGVFLLNNGCAEGYPGVFAKVEHLVKKIQQYSSDGGPVCIL